MIIKNYWRCLFILGLNFLIISGNFCVVSSMNPGSENETCARCRPLLFPRSISQVSSHITAIESDVSYSPLDKGIGLWEIRTELLEDGYRNEENKQKREKIAQELTHRIINYFRMYNPLDYPQHNINGAYYEMSQFYKEIGNTLEYNFYSWLASTYPETE